MYFNYTIRPGRLHEVSLEKNRNPYIPFSATGVAFAIMSSDVQWNSLHKARQNLKKKKKKKWRKMKEEEKIIAFESASDVSGDNYGNMPPITPWVWTLPDAII